MNVPLLDLKAQYSSIKSEVEAAIAEVMDETGKSRSHLMKAWQFNMRKGIPLLAKYNPQRFSLRELSGS